MDCPTNLLSSSDYLGRQRWFNRRARGRTVERHNALISRVEQVACACVRVRGVAWRRRFCCSRPRSLDNKIGSRTRAITHEYSLVQNCEVSLQVHSRLQHWMLSGIISAISSSLMWRQPSITGLFGFNRVEIGILRFLSGPIFWIWDDRWFSWGTSEVWTKSLQRIVVLLEFLSVVVTAMCRRLQLAYSMSNLSKASR